MASSANAAESKARCMSGACRFFKGGSSLCTSRLNDNSENHSNSCPDCKVYKKMTLIGLDKDRKLFSVLFPDGCKSRAFALKAETSEDLLEWITALKNALAQAPSAELATGPGGLFRKDTAEPKPTEPVLKQGNGHGNTINGMPVVIYETPLEVNPHLLQSEKVEEDYKTGTTDTSCSRCQETGHDSEVCRAVIVFGVRLDKPKHP